MPMHDHSGLMLCCIQRVCHGCAVAAQVRGISDCPFCRTPLPGNVAGTLAMIQARVDKKDPEAINLLGEKCYHGQYGLQKDMHRAVKLWEEAADLGSIKALYHLGILYYHGEGVEEDKEKGVAFYIKAAMQGHHESRHLLGIIEGSAGKHDRAVKHLLISAKMGDGTSVETIKKMFVAGLTTKEQYTVALKGYQDAVEEMKSHDRERIPRRRGGNEES